MRGNPEAILQEGIVAGLRLCLPHGWEVIHVPNGGKRSPREGAMFKRMGVRAGFPDIMILGDDARAWFLEVKAGVRKRPTDVQLEMHDRLRDLGFDVVTVWSWDGVVKQCNHWGLPLRFIQET